MRFFNFIFLKRSWASDRLHLSSSLSWLGRRAETQDSPLTFILYPEGTLVSKDTKPLSKKFADKIGIVSLAVLHSWQTLSNTPSIIARYVTQSPSPVNRPPLFLALVGTPYTQLAAH